MTGGVPSPPPTVLFTRAFVALFAAALAFFTAGGMVLPVASRFAAGPLGADATGVGVAIGAFAIASLAIRPAVGWGSDRFGRRPLIIVGCLLTVAALLLHLVVDTLALFVVARALLGIGEAFFFVAILAAVSDLAPSERRGEAINLASLSLYVGLAIGPFVGETILQAAGYAAVWLAACALAGLATLLSLLVPETAPVVVAERAGRAVTRPRGRLIHPAGLFPGFLILTGVWGMAGLFAFLPLHTERIGMGGAGGPLALYAVIVIVLRVVFAKLPDQMGAARLSGAALGTSALGLAVIGLFPDPTALLVGTAIFAAGVAFMFPALISLAVSRVDESERGSVVGTASAFLDLSFGLAPAVLGVVAGANGFGAAFLLSAAIAFGGCVLLVSRRASLARPIGTGSGALAETPNR